MIVGVDEAGRGPLAGVVAACALHLIKNPPFIPKDSKVLSAANRQQMFSWLFKNSVFSVGVASINEIEEHNILNATFLAFERAICQILNKAPYLNNARFIIDGNIFRTSLRINYTCIEKADSKIREVSCASIMAKVSRDYMMELADFVYPNWNFKKHKGYPTKEHYSLIKKYGISPLHRKSFLKIS